MITVNENAKERVRHKLTWDVVVKKYMNLFNLIEHIAFDKAKWQNRIHVANPT